MSPWPPGKALLHQDFKRSDLLGWKVWLRSCLGTCGWTLWKGYELKAQLLLSQPIPPLCHTPRRHPPGKDFPVGNLGHQSFHYKHLYSFLSSRQFPCHTCYCSHLGSHPSLLKVRPPCRRLSRAPLASIYLLEGSSNLPSPCAPITSPSISVRG